MIRRLTTYIATDGGLNKEYVELACLSTDTLPTSGIITGSIATQVDTGTVLFFDEESGEWTEQFSFKG